MDRLECGAMGCSPKQGLRASFFASSEAWTALVDGRPNAMFGLVVMSAIGGEALPWMLGTDEIYRHPREMIRWGVPILRRWADSSPHLSGLVSADNARAIRLLRKWGFAIGEDASEMGGVPFVSFIYEAFYVRTPIDRSSSSGGANCRDNGRGVVRQSTSQI
jgi:hypothetical protein